MSHLSRHPLTRRIGARIQPLEARLMFDAAAAADAAAPAQYAAALADAVAAERPAGSHPSQIAASVEAADASQAPLDADAADARASRREVVFVVDDIPDFERLVAGVRPGVEVMMLDHRRDGLQQIIDALQGRPALDAIHLVSHGEQGQIGLGPTTLTSGNLELYGPQLARLGQTLGPDGDLLIYGCNVAEGDASTFVERLAALTQADVAASIDTSGSAAFHGDWDLEFRSSTVTTEALTFDHSGWQGELATTVYDANWQLLSFNNSTSLVGNGRGNGDIVRYNNVITIDGQAIDAVVTTTLDRATVTTFDSPSTPVNRPDYFQPNITATNAGGGVTFRFDFYQAGTYTGVGTGTAVTLQNVVVNSYDIDSLGGSDRQYQDFKGFARYELANNTKLDTNVQGDGSVRFQATDNTGGDGTDARYRVRVYYDSMSSFELKVGVAGASQGAYFGVEFSTGPVWGVPTTVTGTPAPNLTYSTTTLAEADANDGSIAATATITLANGAFSGSNGQPLSGVTFANVPAGLTAVVTRTSATTAVLSFTGSATAHADANDVDNVTVSFGNGAFASGNAGAVTGATRADIVLDFADPPPDAVAPVIAAGQSFDYAENRTANAVVGTVAASDAVGVTGFRFSATQTGTSADGYFTIADDGTLRITAAGVAAGVAQNDYEVGPNSFAYGVQARDAAGNWSATQDIALNVTDVDDTAPTVTGPGSATGATSAVSIDENTTAVHTFTADEPVSWSIAGGPDAARFGIDADGRLVFNTAPDYEAPNDVGDGANNNTYVVQVRAIDAAGNATTQTVTVTVADVDDTAPVITAGQSFDYAENRSADSVIGTVTASDAVGVTGFRFSATQTNTSADGYFSIDNDGTLRITAAGVAAGVAQNDYEIAPNSFTYGVQARDAAGNWSAAQTVTLNITDVDDTAPIVTGPGSATGATSAITIDENTTAVHTFTADEPATWSIAGGPDAARFGIDADGRLVFDTAPDYEAPNDLGDGANNNTYVVQVRATDAAGNVTTQTVTVTVADVNEPPVAGDAGNADWRPDEGRYVVDTTENVPRSGRIDASDADGDTPSFHVVAPPAHGQFVLDPGTGAWTYTPAIGYHGNDTVVVSIADGRGGYAQVMLDISVAPAPTPAPVPTHPPTLPIEPPRSLPSTALPDPTPESAVPMTASTTHPSDPAAPMGAEVRPVTAQAFDSLLRPTMAQAFDSLLRPATAGAPLADRTLFGIASIERITVGDPAQDLGDIYTRPSGFRAMVRSGPEPALTLFRGVEDQVVKLGHTLDLQIPADAFVHTHNSETVVLYAIQTDGTPLPPWLRFDGRAGTLVGEPPEDWRRDVAVMIVARDSQGREAVAMFRIKVGDGVEQRGAGLSEQLRRGDAAATQGRGGQAQQRPAAVAPQRP